MLHICIGVILIAICFVKGNWRNWKDYYPTILFFILGDTAYNFIFANFPLWIYKFPEWPALGHTCIDLYWGVIIFPCIVILFLTYFPKRLAKQTFYIISWAAGYAIVEFSMFLLKNIEYYNGWNSFFSFLFNICMFIIIYFHYRKPQITWVMVTLIVPLFVLIVKMPLHAIK